MKYLNFIKLDQADLSPEEEAYLDEQLSMMAWLSKNKGSHGRSVSLWEAITIFKDELYALCIDHLAGNDNKEHWNGLLNKIRNDKKLNVERAKAFPIDQLVRRYGYEPKMGFIKSPFLPDQRTGSLKIYLNSNSWYCFGSGQGGDTIDFVMKMNKCPFAEAVKLLT